MADKKPSAPPPTHPATPVIVGFFIVAILGAVLYRFNRFLAHQPALQDFFHTLWLFLTGQISFSELIGATTEGSFAAKLLFVLKALSFGFSAFMIWLIFLVARRHSVVNKKMREPLHPPKEIFYGVSATPEQTANPKWAKVLAHVNSQNPSDWKLAILEADIILNEMLDKMNYQGATMGDKLKSIEPSDFSTLQEAWEAHKVRNAIAHEGSDYVVNKPEAERVIKLFQKVFEEFKFI